MRPRAQGGHFDLKRGDMYGAEMLHHWITTAAAQPAALDALERPGGGKSLAWYSSRLTKEGTSLGDRVEEEGGGGLVDRADGHLVLLRADQVLPQRLLGDGLPGQPAGHLLHLQALLLLAHLDTLGSTGALAHPSF